MTGTMITHGIEITDNMKTTSETCLEHAKEFRAMLAPRRETIETIVLKSIYILTGVIVTVAIIQIVLGS